MMRNDGMRPITKVTAACSGVLGPVTETAPEEDADDEEEPGSMK